MNALPASPTQLRLAVRDARPESPDFLEVPICSDNAMKTRFLSYARFGFLAGLVAGVLAVAAPVRAQIVDFDCGSTGVLGDVVITNDTTLVLPPDGVLHYKSFALKNQAALRFVRNAHNTPVYLLSQGDVIIEGRIYVSGAGSAGTFGRGMGGPGGFDGGNRAVAPMPPGDGQGPGGGRAGLENGPGSAGSAGSGVYLHPYGAGSTNSGKVYGNPVLIPLIGGSGGGGTPTTGGGGGGGAILIASNTRIAMIDHGNAFVDATGGEWGTSGAWNGGSGGAIKMVAPKLTSHRLFVQNRNSTGSPGRIRLDSLDYSNSNWGYVNPAQSLSYGSMLATGLETNRPRLELVSVAGKPLPTNALASGYLLLPPGSSGTQPVVIRAHNFGTRVPVSVVVAPDNGPSVALPVTIDNTTQNPASATVTVDIPANTPIKINAWSQ
jgi:hypothetical protein